MRHPFSRSRRRSTLVGCFRPSLMLSCIFSLDRRRKRGYLHRPAQNARCELHPLHRLTRAAMPKRIQARLARQGSAQGCDTHPAAERSRALAPAIQLCTAWQASGRRRRAVLPSVAHGMSALRQYTVHRTRAAMDCPLPGRVTAAVGPQGNSRATNNPIVEIRMVDANGNMNARPNSLNRKSPGKRPMPSFSSQGNKAEKTISAMKIVNTHRIIRGPS